MTGAPHRKGKVLVFGIPRHVRRAGGSEEAKSWWGKLRRGFEFRGEQA
jgi:hypothetical protein